MTTITETMREWDGPAGMSNCDFEIEPGVEEVLKAAPNQLYAQHAAWNFCGYFWWSGDRWKEEVWRYNAVVKVVEAGSLVELRKTVNDEFGWD